ncbi:triose-phosphate isomerase [Candidatus Jidaibacter acanthamoebae]|nr:triose-phosphate isomerase [Candidatus Jidaibacter acanthamoeba]
MHKKILIANWKMNGNSESLKSLAEYYVNMLTGQQAEVVLCPAHPYLSLVNNITKNSPVKLGAQNIASFPKGSYTGEVSGEMLTDIGCKYVIIGHYERRKFFNERGEEIARKIDLAVQSNLIPILCVGEKLNKRKEGTYLSFIKEQIENSQILYQKNAVIAYEPVWSIGTGVIPTVEEIAEVVDMITTMSKAKVLYGGSVSADNSCLISDIANLDGFLVGAASLKAEEFHAIYKSLLG